VVAVRRRSRASDAIWTAFTEVIRFVVVPYVLVDLITSNYPDLETAFMPEIRLYIVFFGLMIASASTLEAANRMGTFKRMLFGLSSLAFICLWLFVIFGGGIASFRWGQYYVEFDMSKIVYIMLAGVSLKAILVVDTYSVHRHTIKEDEALERLRSERRRTAARKQAIARRAASEPSFSTLSRVQYRVTPDDEVGFSPEATRQRAHQPPAQEVAGPSAECSICGEPVRSTDTVCKNCGAWISRPLR